MKALLKNNPKTNTIQKLLVVVLAAVFLFAGAFFFQLPNRLATATDATNQGSAGTEAVSTNGQAATEGTTEGTTAEESAESAKQETLITDPSLTEEQAQKIKSMTPSALDEEAKSLGEQSNESYLFNVSKYVTGDYTLKVDGAVFETPAKIDLEIGNTYKIIDNDTECKIEFYKADGEIKHTLEVISNDPNRKAGWLSMFRDTTYTPYYIAHSNGEVHQIQQKYIDYGYEFLATSYPVPSDPIRVSTSVVNYDGPQFANEAYIESKPVKDIVYTSPYIQRQTQGTLEYDLGKYQYTEISQLAIQPAFNDNNSIFGFARYEDGYKFLGWRVKGSDTYLEETSGTQFKTIDFTGNTLELTAEFQKVETISIDRDITKGFGELTVDGSKIPETRYPYTFEAPYGTTYVLDRNAKTLTFTHTNSAGKEDFKKTIGYIEDDTLLKFRNETEGVDASSNPKTITKATEFKAYFGEAHYATVNVNGGTVSEVPDGWVKDGANYKKVFAENTSFSDITKEWDGKVTKEKWNCTWDKTSGTLDRDTLFNAVWVPKAFTNVTATSTEFGKIVKTGEYAGHANQVPKNSTYQHTEGSNTMSFKYDGVDAPTYTAQPSSITYKIQDFYASTDAEGKNKIANGATITQNQIYVFAIIYPEVVNIVFKVSPDNKGYVSPNFIEAKYGSNCTFDGDSITFDGATGEQKTVVSTPIGSYHFSHYSITEEGTTTKLEDGTYPVIFPLAGGITANFATGHHAKVTFNTSEIKGDTTKNLVAAGWKATVNEGNKTTTYSKTFDTDKTIDDAVADFNGVSKTIVRDGAVFKQVLYTGNATSFDKDVELDPIFTFNVSKGSVTPEGSGTLAFDPTTASSLNFVSAHYKAENNKIIFSNAKYFDDDTKTLKEHAGFTLTANATDSGKFAFKSWDLAQAEGDLSSKTEFSATFNKLYKITLDYNGGSPVSSEKFAEKGWLYAEDIAAKSFVEGTDIASIFADGSASWDKDLEPTKEGHTAKWNPDRTGTLTNDTRYTAVYTPNPLNFSAVANPTQAASIAITPEGKTQVQYGDTVVEDETTHSLTINHTEGGETKAVAQISFTPNTSWAFTKWTAVGDDGKEITDFKSGIKKNIKFVANFEQKFVKVTFDNYSLNDASYTYTKAGETGQTYTETKAFDIPEGYTWATATTKEGAEYPDTIEFKAPDGSLYSTCVINPSTANPLALYMDENARWYRPGESGTVTKALTFYPVTFNKSQEISVKSDVNDAAKGSAANYLVQTEGEVIAGNPFPAAKPISYEQKTEGTQNYLEIKTSTEPPTTYRIKATPNGENSFIGWAYQTKSMAEAKWLNDTTGIFSEDVTFTACFDALCKVTFKVADGQSDLGKIDHAETYQVRSGQTEYVKNENDSITLSDIKYGEIVTVTPSAYEPNFFNMWTGLPEGSTTISGDTTAEANFTKGYVVTMDAGKGQFVTAPSDWKAVTQEDKTVYVKNFKTGASYKDIVTEWADYHPTKTGYTFDKWKVDDEGSVVTKDTTFTATYTPNKYKVTFFLKGGHAKTSGIGSWVYDEATDSYSNSTYTYGTELSQIDSDFKDAVGNISRDKFTFTGNFSSDAEGSTLTKETNFSALYSYQMKVDSDENGTIETAAQTEISGIDEQNVFTVNLKWDNILELKDKDGKYKELTYKPVANTGYKFVNWTDDAGNVLTTGKTYAQNTTLTANFTLQEYEVKFTTNNQDFGKVTTDPAEPQTLKHFTKLTIGSGEYADWGSFSEAKTLKTLYSGQAIPTPSTAEYSYYFDKWVIKYADGSEKEVNPNKGLTEDLTQPVEVQAQFSKEYTRYNISAEVDSGEYLEPKPTVVDPWLLSNVPYNSKLAYKDHVVTVTSPEGAIVKEFTCTPGEWSVQTAWKFNETLMEEGKEYTLTGHSKLTAVVAEGSVLKGKVYEKDSEYPITGAVLYFEYDSPLLNSNGAAANELNPQTVGPVYSDENGNYEFSDPRLLTGKSGTLYMYRAGYQIGKKQLTITSGTMVEDVEVLQCSGIMDVNAESEGHNYFDSTIDGTLFKESGPKHTQPVSIHHAVSAAMDPETEGKDKGTTITLEKDKITTYYETLLENPQSNDDPDKYWDAAVIIPVAKEGYAFDHFTYEGKDVEPGYSFEVKEDEVYKIGAVYKVADKPGGGGSDADGANGSASGTGTGTGSTGDNLWIFFLIAGIVLVAAGCGIGYALYRKNKGNKKDKYIPKH